MSKTSMLLELLFGIGFRMGFILAFAAIFMMYIPAIEMHMAPLLQYIGFYDAVQTNPQWKNILITGILMMAVAVAVALIYRSVSEMIDILFAEEKPHIPRS